MEGAIGAVRPSPGSWSFGVEGVVERRQQRTRFRAGYRIPDRLSVPARCDEVVVGEEREVLRNSRITNSQECDEFADGAFPLDAVQEEIVTGKDASGR